MIVVQPTDDGRVLVARMSPASGRWQLPGGSLEPPRSGAVLDESALAGQATRELAEELCTGASPPPEPEAVGGHPRQERQCRPDVPRPSPPEATLRAGFTAAAAAERAQGRDPELDGIALVHSLDELAALAGPDADYLDPIVRRLSGRR
ncbi:NUDIX domain-containing protein [Streptomyces sp. NPDC047990]|uniref:NUDIX domain-containing protein n=1 Tax=Streptomyces sp. NPDC047990 TaxID=3365496 RepID=UPI0037195CB5